MFKKFEIISSFFPVLTLSECDGSEGLMSSVDTEI